ncbi:MAG: ammonium transporter [Dehalococcoidia bacterium]|nr:ammonium transporter [Dehalococcoidia bacterium]
MIDTGNTTWVLVATALVFLMLPGVALLEIGFARAKNSVSIMMQVFTITFLAGIIFMVLGFSLSFGPSIGGVIGGGKFLGLANLGAQAWPGTTIPGYAFFGFQLMFAAVTVALVTGSIAERMKYPAFFALAAVFLLVYSLPTHWIWGGGWLQTLGMVDFAGSTVVHITAGSAALVAAIVLGRRVGFGQTGLEGHSIPFGALGAFLLWMGWFGFNGGSALAADGVAATALVTTNTGAAAGALVVTILTWAYLGKPSIVMSINGSLAGLAAVTGGAGYVSPMSALLIGGIAGTIMFYSVALIKGRLRIDDALDVSSIHGLPGVWGTLAVGLFADGRLGGVTGLFFGGGVRQLGVQALGAVVVFGVISALTFGILKLIQVTIGLRSSKKEEIAGLDISDHREPAYS